MSRRAGRKWEDVPLVDAPATDLDRVAELAVLLAELERRREAAVQLRDELVARERSRGTSWDVLAAAAGTTRQALMKRL